MVISDICYFKAYNALLHTSFSPLLTLKGRQNRYYYRPHFTDEGTGLEGANDVLMADGW